ncbi:MAG: hypothetical protein R3F20_06325 [Planctomycetota bacterium]
MRPERLLIGVVFLLLAGQIYPIIREKVRHRAEERRNWTDLLALQCHAETPTVPVDRVQKILWLLDDAPDLDDRLPSIDDAAAGRVMVDENTLPIAARMALDAIAAFISPQTRPLTVPVSAPNLNLALAAPEGPFTRALGWERYADHPWPTILRGDDLSRLEILVRLILATRDDLATASLVRLARSDRQAFPQRVLPAELDGWAIHALVRRRNLAEPIPAVTAALAEHAPTLRELCAEPLRADARQLPVLRGP